MLDDFDNLSAMKGGVNDKLSFFEYLSNGYAGPTGRPISKISFLLDDNAWPSSPENFKQTNLSIHLLIGVFLFLLLRKVVSNIEGPKVANWIALLVMAIWLVHPLQVSTVSYVIQRMTQLSSLFIVIFVTAYTYWRSYSLPSKLTSLIIPTLLYGIFFLLAVFSKENGALLPLYVAVVELTLFSKKTTSKALRQWRNLFIYLPSLLLLAYIAYFPHWIPSYESREFTLSERLITEPVVLFDYLRHLFTFEVHGLGLLQDDYPVYSSLLSAKPFLAMSAIIALVFFSLRYRKDYPIVAFGILWFFAGHIIESTTISLELYFEHRNYLPILGPILAFTIIAYRMLSRARLRVRVVLFSCAFFLVGTSASITYGYAKEWGDPLRILPIWSVEHPDSSRAQRIYAHVLASRGMTYGALDVLDESYQRFPKDLSMPIISIDISCRFDLPLRYDLRILSDRISEHEITDGLRPALTSLFESITNSRCREHIPALHAFVPKLGLLENNYVLNRLVASIYVLDGELYLRQGNLMGALSSFVKIEEMLPTEDSALRLAQIYTMFMDYDRAIEFVRIAQSRHNQGNVINIYEKKYEYEESVKKLEKLRSMMESATRETRQSVDNDN